MARFFSPGASSVSPTAPSGRPALLRPGAAFSAFARFGAPEEGTASTGPPPPPSSPFPLAVAEAFAFVPSALGDAGGDDVALDLGGEAVAPSPSSSSPTAFSSAAAAAVFDLRRRGERARGAAAFSGAGSVAFLVAFRVFLALPASGSVGGSCLGGISGKRECAPPYLPTASGARGREEGERGAGALLPLSRERARTPPPLFLSHTLRRMSAEDEAMAVVSASSGPDPAGAELMGEISAFLDEDETAYRSGSRAPQPKLGQQDVLADLRDWMNADAHYSAVISLSGGFPSQGGAPGIMTKFPNAPLTVINQRKVLATLSGLMCVVALLAVVVFATAEPHRNSVYAGPAVASVAGIAAVSFLLMLFLQRHRFVRAFPFTAFVCCMGLCLGFLGVWMGSLMPVMTPVTLILCYACLGIASACTRDTFRARPYMIITGLAVVASTALWWLAVNQGFSHAWQPLVALAVAGASMAANVTVFLTLETLRRKQKTPHCVEDAIFYAYVDPALVLLRALSCCCYCRTPAVGGFRGYECCGGAVYCHPSVCFAPDVDRFTEFDLSELSRPLKEDGPEDGPRADRAKTGGGGIGIANAFKVELYPMNHDECQALIAELLANSGCIETSGGHYTRVVVVEEREAHHTRDPDVEEGYAPDDEGDAYGEDRGLGPGKEEAHDD